MNNIRTWEFGAPIGKHCCEVDCLSQDSESWAAASWTLVNPWDGGDPLYFCEECFQREVGRHPFNFRGV